MPRPRILTSLVAVVALLCMSVLGRHAVVQAASFHGTVSLCAMDPACTPTAKPVLVAPVASFVFTTMEPDAATAAAAAAEAVRTSATARAKTGGTPEIPVAQLHALDAPGLLVTMRPQLVGSTAAVAEVQNLAVNISMFDSSDARIVELLKDPGSASEMTPEQCRAMEAHARSTAETTFGAAVTSHIEVVQQSDPQQQWHVAILSCHAVPLTRAGLEQANLQYDAYFVNQQGTFVQQFSADMQALPWTLVFMLAFHSLLEVWLLAQAWRARKVRKAMADADKGLGFGRIMKSAARAAFVLAIANLVALTGLCIHIAHIANFGEDGEEAVGLEVAGEMLYCFFVVMLMTITASVGEGWTMSPDKFKPAAKLRVSIFCVVTWMLYLLTVLWPFITSFFAPLAYTFTTMTIPGILIFACYGILVVWLVLALRHQIRYSREMIAGGQAVLDDIEPSANLDDRTMFTHTVIRELIHKRYMMKLLLGMAIVWAVINLLLLLCGGFVSPPFRALIVVPIWYTTNMLVLVALACIVGPGAAGPCGCRPAPTQPVTLTPHIGVFVDYEDKTAHEHGIVARTRPLKNGLVAHTQRYNDQDLADDEASDGGRGLRRHNSGKSRMSRHNSGRSRLSRRESGRSRLSRRESGKSRLSRRESGRSRLSRRESGRLARHSSKMSTRSRKSSLKRRNTGKSRAGKASLPGVISAAKHARRLGRGRHRRPRRSAGADGRDRRRAADQDEEVEVLNLEDEESQLSATPVHHVGASSRHLASRLHTLNRSQSDSQLALGSSVLDLSDDEAGHVDWSNTGTRLALPARTRVVADAAARRQHSNLVPRSAFGGGAGAGTGAGAGAAGAAPSPVPEADPIAAAFKVAQGSMKDFNTPPRTATTAAAAAGPDSPDGFNLDDFMRNMQAARNSAANSRSGHRGMSYGVTATGGATAGAGGAGASRARSRSPAFRGPTATGRAGYLDATKLSSPMLQH